MTSLAARDIRQVELVHQQLADSIFEHLAAQTNERKANENRLREVADVCHKMYEKIIGHQYDTEMSRLQEHRTSEQEPWNQEHAEKSTTDKEKQKEEL